LPAREENIASAVFFSVVDSEDDWSETATFAKRYFKAYAAADATVLAIAARGEMTADALASRVQKLLERLNLREEHVASVDLIDEDDVVSWAAAYPAQAMRFAVNERAALKVSNLAALDDRSPSALRRLLEGAA
ncbi:MAG: hypothetical protein JO165_07210, partial [Candidatus Eremiobacteraeota bacterium]|nr:hypothetical protein [Candidatus Eremiobacteraeota bacterium]